MGSRGTPQKRGIFTPPGPPRTPSRGVPPGVNFGVKKPKSRQNRFSPGRNLYRFRESAPIYLIINIPATRYRVDFRAFSGLFRGFSRYPETGVFAPPGFPRFPHFPPTASEGVVSYRPIGGIPILCFQENRILPSDATSPLTALREFTLPSRRTGDTVW